MPRQVQSGVSPPSAARVRQIRPFYVMQVLEQALQMQSNGADVIQLQLGEPDFDTPAPVTEAYKLDQPSIRLLTAGSLP